LELNPLQQQIKRIVIHPFSALFLLLQSSFVLQGGMALLFFFLKLTNNQEIPIFQVLVEADQ
jgi:hypothetical protein